MGARVLFLHGLLSGRSAWDGVVAGLPAGVEAIVPDLLGYGSAATAPCDDYTLEAVSAHLEALLDDAAPTHIVGQSMGGIVALALAARHPGRFEGLGLIGLPVFADRADGLAFLHRRGLSHRLLLHHDTLSHAGCVGMHLARRAWAPTIPLFVPRQPRAHVLAAFHHNRASHEGSLDRVIFAGHVPGLAEAMRVPVAALHGGRDRAAPLERVRELAAASGWRFHVAPTANHQLPVERPALVARWVMSHVLGSECGR